MQEAMEKRAESGHDILYLLQDMQDFELYGTVRAVISVCDSMNYLTDEEDLEYLFALVNNYLDPGGLFIFDMIQNTSTGRFWGVRPLQNPERTAVLSGIIIIMRKSGSMNTN